ncbi:MAG: GAF domain-containing protein [Anaerolineae bacterium]|nr:GAF domain-containing protein [Anaerolineae bacterium]
MGIDEFAAKEEQSEGKTTGLLFNWRIRLSRISDPGEWIELDLTEEAILGIGEGSPVARTLQRFDGEQKGVSRQHAILRASGTELSVVDLGSTNGTTVNGELIKPDLPHPLEDGDRLSLGGLDLLVTVIEGIKGRVRRKDTVELADALVQMAKAITSHLELEEVFKQALAMSMKLTSAGEAAIWLLDETTHQLYVEAGVGLNDDHIKKLRVPVTGSLVGAALTTGKPIRTSRNMTGSEVKVKTGYVVEAVLYIPLVHGSNRLGVLAAVHREQGHNFSERDEHLLESIGDFTALALQNAQMYQKLQEASHLKQEMIQNVSHEFRTPIQYILGYTELLLEEKERLDPAHAEYVENLAHQTRRLTWMMDNFLSLQLVNSMVSQRFPSNIGPIVEGAVGNARMLSREKKITLTHHIDANLPKAFISPMGIYQVLDNLIANALKFTESGGSVSVAVKHDERGGAITVTVTDTGIGIAPADHARIFERFVQVDGSSRRTYEGVGLGLTVCKSIVEEHGGRIGVESELGRGAMFWFTIPTDDGG